MKRAYLIRGLPGSGKSTIATELAKSAIADGKSAIIHTTDDYHMVNGKYCYDASKARAYHKKNLLAFQRSCRKSIDVVICPNTNINEGQYGPYEDYAKAHGYKVFKIIMDAFAVKQAGRRTAHKMPENIIRGMKCFFEVDGKRMFPEL